MVLVVNGPLHMSPGKLAGQTFQAAVRMSALFVWEDKDTRTIVKEAKTPAMFERICKEIPGYTMVDVGTTELAHYGEVATVHVCGPFLHKDRPKLLDNKKVGLVSSAHEQLHVV